MPGACPWRKVEWGALIICGTDPRVSRGLLVAGPGQWVLAGTPWGGRVISGLLGGSWGGKVDSLGWRGFGSSGGWAAIITQIHGFLTVGGGVG